MLDAEAALARGRGRRRARAPAAAAEAIAAACRAERFDAGRAGPGGPGRRQPGDPARRGARGGGARGRPAVGAPRRHQPGHPRHRRRAGRPPRRWIDRGTTCRDLADGCAALAGRHRAHADGGADAAAAGAADHVRAEGGRLAGGGARGAAAAGRRRWPAGGAAGGAAGTLASLGDAGPAVVARFAAAPRPARARSCPGTRPASGSPSWARRWPSRPARAAKIAGDVGLLAQSEVGEAAEPAGPGRGGSSTLPHKRNPVGAALARAAAARAQALAAVLLGALVAEHERPLGAWHSEWQPLTELLALVRRCRRPHGRDGGRASRSTPRAMAANLGPARGALLAERVSLALCGDPRAAAPPTSWWPTPSGAAHDRCVRRWPTSCADEPLRWPARGSTTTRRRRPAGELLDPAGYLGATDTWIDRALAAHADAGGGSHADQTIEAAGRRWSRDGGGGRRPRRAHPGRPVPVPG